MTLKCPECAETKVMELTPNILDRVLRLFGAHPYRCTFCRTFFHSRATPAAIHDPGMVETESRWAA
jgi:hypothetical protein